MSREPEIVTRFRRLMETTDDDDLTAIAYNSPAVHFALFMEIRDKNGRYIRPTPNVLQLRVSEVIETLRERCPGVRIRIVGVKPRRAGLSTFSLHCGYHEAQRRPIEGITIADRRENSAMLTERLADYSGHDSFPWENPLTQDVTHSKAWANGSKWVIDTAENPDAGVGGTRQFGHFSECSKFSQTEKKNDVKTMTAALPALNGDDTTCIAESTPEGAQGWFYDTFDGAMWLDDFLKRWEEGFRPEQVWIRVFAAWWEFAENSRQQPVSEIERQFIDDTMSDEERDDRKKFDLTYEQLAWRRDTIESECGGNPKVFLYYYPKDPVSCWIASGSPRFDMETLVLMEQTANGITPETGYLARQHDGQITFHAQRDGTGDIEVFDRPVPGCKYGVVIDPAESISQTIGANPDANSVCVWRQGYHDQATDRWRPLKMVARLKAPFYGEEDEVAAHAEKLSRFYGLCIVAQEVNKGYHCMRCLQNAGIPLYRRTPMSHRTGNIEKQIGFKMSDKGNREAMISSLASAIVTGDIETHCNHMLSEWKAFVRKPNGKSEAAAGHHDDDVINAAIAWEVVPTCATLYKVTRVRNVEPRDEGRGGWRTVNATSR